MLKKILEKIHNKISSPNQLAKELGVQFGKNCKFGTKGFGSEPYLIKIGDDFYSSSHVQFVTHDGSVNVLRNLHDEYKSVDSFAPISIGNNVFIGYGVTILPGTVTGDNVIVGAGSIVKGVLKSNSVYAGVPVKYICSIDKYLDRKREDLILTKHLSPKEKKEQIIAWVSKKYPDFF